VNGSGTERNAGKSRQSKVEPTALWPTSQANPATGEQRQLLKMWRITSRQIGDDAGRKGMQDEEIIPLLHRSDHPTFWRQKDMAFQDEHSPSIIPKALVSAGILAGTLARSDISAGNETRQLIILSCCLIYFFRATICNFIFLKRKVSWIEGCTVSFLFFIMFDLWVVSAGSHTEPIWLIDIVGLFLFLTGSFINTLADYQRFIWKRKIENKGRLYTKGLFKYSMHINYFGDSMAYVGLAMITMEVVCLFPPFAIIAIFVAYMIPTLDLYLSKKYADEFEDYSKQTKKYIPFVY